MFSYWPSHQIREKPHLVCPIYIHSLKVDTHSHSYNPPFDQYIKKQYTKIPLTNISKKRKKFADSAFQSQKIQQMCINLNKEILAQKCGFYPSLWQRLNIKVCFSRGKISKCTLKRKHSLWKEIQFIKLVDFFTICFLDNSLTRDLPSFLVAFFVWNGVAVGLGGELQTIVASAHSLFLSPISTMEVGGNRHWWCWHRSWWKERSGRFFGQRKHLQLYFEMLKLWSGGWV